MKIVELLFLWIFLAGLFFFNGNDNIFKPVSKSEWFIKSLLYSAAIVILGVFVAGGIKEFSSISW